MAKKKKVEVVKTPEDEIFSSFDSIMQSTSNATLKALDASPLQLDAKVGSNHAFSTTSLCLDLITGGGAPKHRMTVFSGGSYLGKTTLLQRVMNSALLLKTNSHYIDMEGAADPNWMRRNGIDFENYMGSKNGPRRLTFVPDLRSGEDVFNYQSRIMDGYLDWVRKGGEEVNRFLKFAQERGYPTLAFFLDSLAACIPKAFVEDDESAAMAGQAKMFSLKLPLIRSKMLNSNSIFVTVNQLRQKPGVKYGSPDYEPGGNAPTFYADLKVKLDHASKPKTQTDSGTDKDHALVVTDNIAAGGIHTEYNLNGSTDEYKYVKLTTIKNRVFTPFQTTYLRIWVHEDGAAGRGVDPVFDTIHFYEMLGMAAFHKPSKGALECTLEGKTYKYTDLKSEILRNPDLTLRGFEMIKTGEAFDKYFAFKSTKDEEEQPLSPELEQETEENFKSIEHEIKHLEDKANA